MNFSLSLLLFPSLRSYYITPVTLSRSTIVRLRSCIYSSVYNLGAGGAASKTMVVSYSGSQSLETSRAAPELLIQKSVALTV
ncbi:hypothetical protein D9758_016117 [Tetrapyrgos nigripes]|uniref:Secreted protein n=1 Tax=Tetrapyrgos nigripes TaxID=182062 RepID=A0A8H5BZB2_9AGAR|nr:hypothetical protein D9758_016117 [Tetrapyrgos nigripes]